MNEHDHGMTGAWALDAVDAEERLQVERLLAADPEAAAEARSFVETSGELAASLAPLSPPPALRSAVLARIATTRQLSPLPEQEDPAPAAEGEVVSLHRYRASIRRSRWSTAAAAVLALCTLAGVGLWTSERAAQEATLSSLEAMASQMSETEEEQRMISSIMTSPDATHLVIPSDAGGTVQLMYSRDRQEMLVQTADLPPLPEERTYQLWMIDGAEITSAGLLGTPTGSMMREGPLPAGVQVGLSVEPAGGSAQPSTTPIVLEELT